MRQLNDLTGRIFGKLSVISICRDRKRIHWNCICKCGNTAIIRTDILTGGAKSCGCECSSRDLFKEQNLTHGLSKSKEYQCWEAMKGRCLNPHNRMYKWYGGKGVLICKEWIDSFEIFYNDMGLKPTPKHTIDRFPDKNGNYEPSNCRWATRKEQDRNLKRNVWLEYRGERLIITDWATKLNTTVSAISHRIKSTSFEEIVESFNYTV